MPDWVLIISFSSGQFDRSFFNTRDEALLALERVFSSDCGQFIDAHERIVTMRRELITMASVYQVSVFVQSYLESTRAFGGVVNTGSPTTLETLQ